MNVRVWGILYADATPRRWTLNPQFRATVRPAYITLVVICAAIGAGILIMVVIAVMLLGSMTTDATRDGLGILLPIFLVLGGLSLVAATVVRRRTMPSAQAAADLDQALARLRTGTILACAFSEVPAILGLAYVILNGSLTWAPVFFGAALISLAFSVPRMSQWEDALATGPQGVPSVADS